MPDNPLLGVSDLRNFVPPDTFDAHAHLYQRKDASPSVPAELEDDSGNAGLQEYRRAVAAWLGDRGPASGLFFPFPRAGNDRAAANDFLHGELAKDPGSRGLMLIAPGDAPETVEAEVVARGWAGFKVYHVYARRDQTFYATLDEFLPDWAWKMANRRGLVIMLHIVRERALADPANQQYLRDRCLRFPAAKLILAHAARGFCGHHTVEAISSLRGLDNVYFDTSAICEPSPFEAILKACGPSRLLFGTDFPVSEMRGKCVSIGDGFLWLYEDTVDWTASPFAHPERIGLESLAALRTACQNLHLSTTDIEAIFGGNARQILHLTETLKPTDGRTQQLYQRAKRQIPGGTQLLSKRPEMYAPGHWPAYFREARGCEVIDLDGRKYLDMTTSGIGSCLLGYADPDVNAAVGRRVMLGSMSTLSPAEEVELADLLFELHPWAEQARFTRSGGEAMAVAIRLVRAATGRDKIAFCGYHGWSDWYLAANLIGSGETDTLGKHLLPGLEPAGVPAGLAETLLPFTYNQIDELADHVAKKGEQIAAVVMEPTRSVHPKPQFLEEVRRLCSQCGALLFFDEISSGWRLHLGGAHRRYGIDPDVAVFAKAISNGYPMGAVIGRENVMQAAQRSFISSTYWTEGIGPTAALATIRKMASMDLPAHVERIGSLLRQHWLDLGKRHGVPVKSTGHAAILSLGFEHPQALAISTLVTQRLLVEGILFSGGFYPSLAHEERHVDRLATALHAVFEEVATAIDRQDIVERVGGAELVRHAGFARLT